MEADQADARRGAGDSERPLLGVPIAVKDEFDVAGEVTTFGTNAYGEPARADSEIVRRARAAGAMVIGKTHMPELGAVPWTESPTWGVTRNPWQLQRSPGGSSGGSAAAVAAGLVGAALAGDGGGSIRVPVGLLRPVRAEDPARARAACAARWTPGTACVSTACWRARCATARCSTTRSPTGRPIPVRRSSPPSSFLDALGQPSVATPGGSHPRQRRTRPRARCGSPCRASCRPRR